MHPAADTVTSEGIARSRPERYGARGYSHSRALSILSSAPAPRVQAHRSTVPPVPRTPLHAGQAFGEGKESPAPPETRCYPRFLLAEPILFCSAISCIDGWCEQESMVSCVYLELACGHLLA
jgi:hypothetical protein